MTMAKDTFHTAQERIKLKPSCILLKNNNTWVDKRNKQRKEEELGSRLDIRRPERECFQDRVSLRL